MAGISIMSSEGRPDGLQDFVARQLAKAIASGELPPGTRLSPAKLAEELGVSHIPVREALAALEAVGQVRRIPRVGFFVAELSTDDIEDIYHWRQVLEDEAHRLGVPKLEEADLVRMRQLNADMLTSIHNRNTPSFVELNRTFHFVPFQRAGSDHLIRFITHLWDAAARYQNTMAYVRVPKDLLQEHHDALMTAFENRDVGAVNGWMAKHRGVTLGAIRKIHAAAAEAEKAEKAEVDGVDGQTPARARAKAPAKASGGKGA
ncbi:GntR family transcriptional regulator [Actinophytocola oryzae]|uniref:GntR family transcriptional regulator n=1 Tax=Actinophytocola oryzae TaxID=502181 RepID=A0A4R7W1E4_9PSEU|nr:GntR family transcriptional regulator [Actinophytocola oryzae]TDV56366.1 GntR family transcriptional regulator [Actinophytocola oryzae]